MLSHRLQVLIDAERHERLAREARIRGTSIGEVVRDAIDRALPAVSPERARAARDILEAEPMPVPDPDELRRELDDARGRVG